MSSLASYRKARDKAEQISIDNPGQCFYVNWIEENSWSIDTEPELGQYQDYWLNGKHIIPEYDLDEYDLDEGE